MEPFKRIAGIPYSLHRFCVASVLGGIVYVFLGYIASGYITQLYSPNSVIFASTHFNDARQYVNVCISGFNLATDYSAPTLGASRLSWMPLLPGLLCDLRNVFGISLVYAGFWISSLAATGTLFFTMLTLRNLGAITPTRFAFLIFVPPISAIYLFLAGSETLFLLISSILMFLMTSSVKSIRLEILRIVSGVLVGFILMMAKPNALSLVPPLLLAFAYLNWKRSQLAGYQRAFNNFIPDMIYKQVALWRTKQENIRPIEFDWFPLFSIAGILLGFAIWEWYSSWFSGVPYFFTQQQLQFWTRPWRPGDLGTMFLYFAQAFRGASLATPYRLASAWYLLVLLSALIPVFSSRVPVLIRLMILPLPLFLLATGAVHQYDRYIASLITVGLGWVYWVQGKKWRWVVLFSLAICTSLLYPYLYQAGVFSNTVVVDR